MTSGAQDAAPAPRAPGQGESLQKRLLRPGACRGRTAGAVRALQRLWAGPAGAGVACASPTGASSPPSSAGGPWTGRWGAPRAGLLPCGASCGCASLSRAECGGSLAVTSRVPPSRASGRWAAPTGVRDPARFPWSFSGASDGPGGLSPRPGFSLLPAAGPPTLRGMLTAVLCCSAADLPLGSAPARPSAGSPRVTEGRPHTRAPQTRCPLLLRTSSQGLGSGPRSRGGALSVSSVLGDPGQPLLRPGRDRRWRPHRPSSADPRGAKPRLASSLASAVFRRQPEEPRGGSSPTMRLLGAAPPSGRTESSRRLGTTIFLGHTLLARGRPRARSSGGGAFVRFAACLGTGLWGPSLAPGRATPVPAQRPGRPGRPAAGVCGLASSPAETRLCARGRGAGGLCVCIGSAPPSVLPAPPPAGCPRCTIAM